MKNIIKVEVPPRIVHRSHRVDLKSYTSPALAIYEMQEPKNNRKIPIHTKLRIDNPHQTGQKTVYQSQSIISSSFKEISINVTTLTILIIEMIN